MSLPITEAASLTERILKSFEAPGAGIALVAGDEVRSWGYGVCEKGASAPVSADSTFQLASCSKAYTAMTTAILVDQGQLAWDDPVRKHLPEFRMHDERLAELATLRDLLSMRLGYRKEGLVDWGRNTELGVDYIFERLPYLEVIAGFRERFTYLNAAYTLMTDVIARRTGTPFVTFQAETVHRPLGQSNTFVREGKHLPSASHAFPHVLLDTGVEPLGEARCGGRLGESCVYSSASDAARWLWLHLGNGEIEGKRLVSAASLHEMHRSHVYGPNVPALDNYLFGYGMGWQCRDSPNGPLLMHEGGEFGVSSHTILDPLRRIGVAVYTNLGSGAAVKSVSYSLLDLAAGRTPRDWAAIFRKLDEEQRETMETALAKMLDDDPQPEFPEKEILGSYFHAANGIIEVCSSGKGIEVKVRDGWVYDALLEPLGRNVYRTRCRYKGMQAQGRQLNPRMKFLRVEQGIALRAPGFGIFRKLD